MKEEEFLIEQAIKNKAFKKWIYDERFRRGTTKDRIEML